MTQDESGPRSDSQLLAALTLVLRRWRILLAVPVVIAVGAVVATLVGRQYTAASSFMPETPSNQQNQLLGLAAQFGITLSPPEAGISVDFYRSLLRSREILWDLAQTQFHFAADAAGRDSLKGNLVDLLNIPEGGPRGKLKKTEEKLAKVVSVSVDRLASVVEVRTTAPWPELAEMMNRRLLELVNTFNVEKRTSSAAARRDFTGRRVIEAEGELRAAENELRDFLEKNRRYQDSPELVFEQMGLERRVDLRQQVAATLTQVYEQARVDAVRDVPLITIVEVPEGSVTPSLGLRRSGLLGLIFGLLLAIGYAMVTEYLVQERRRRPEAYAEFARTWDRTIGRLLPASLRSGITKP